MEKNKQNNEDSSKNLEDFIPENISTCIKQLEEQRDSLIKQEYYFKAKEYDHKIEIFKAKENKQKTKKLKRIHSSELIQLNDEFRSKHDALLKKWEEKMKEMNSIIANKVNNLNEKHTKEKKAFNDRNMSINNTISSSFYKSVWTSLNRPPATYLNLKKKQEMIFKGKNRDYTLAEKLKKESDKLLKEESNKKMIKMKKDSQTEYYKLIKRQEEEMNKLKYEIKSNVELMNFMKEKEFELLDQTFKNKTSYINRSQNIDVMLSKKIERYRQSKLYYYGYINILYNK